VDNDAKMAARMTTEVIDRDEMLVRLHGRLDAIGIDGVESQFTAALAASGRRVLVDLSDVDFIASLGLRMFIVAVKAAKRRGHPVVFYGAQAAVRQVLEHAAFDKVAPVVAERATARGRLHSA
jgi:anti-anti-sigma factor